MPGSIAAAVPDGVPVHAPEAFSTGPGKLEAAVLGAGFWFCGGHVEADPAPG
jgi:hypothetical protein